MVRLRVPVIGVVLIASLTIGVAPVLAAAPSNDTYAGATVISALPYDEILDTSDVTTDAIDGEANADCGAPATLASVWYEFTPTADGAFIVDVSGSDYSAGVIVVSGSPGAFVLEDCGPYSTVLFGSAGVTYHILAFSDTPGVNGGVLPFPMEGAPPPPPGTPPPASASRKPISVSRRAASCSCCIRCLTSTSSPCRPGPRCSLPTRAASRRRQPI